jgi:hypothetical protein
MATTKVQLPSGEAVRVQHKEGASEQDILQYAFEQYVINDATNMAIGRGIAQGVDNLQKAYGSSVEGIGSFLDSESLKQIGADIVTQQEADIAARQFRTQRDIPQDVGTFTEGMRYVETLAGESAPQMATTLAGAAAGAAAGSFVPVVGTTVGAFVGGFLANVPYFYGSNRERQKEAIEQGIKTEVDEGAAALAAIPQSALDAIIGALGAKFLATPAMKAGGGVFTRAAKGSAVGSVTEAPTEIGQVVLERDQAGLSLTSKEAMVEYAHAGVGGAILGGLLGGGGAVMSRTPAGTEQQRKEVVGEKKPFAVRYERTTKDGGTFEVNEIIYADSMEDAQAQANELLSKDNAVLNQTLTVTSAPTPMDAAPGLVPKQDRYKYNVKIEEEDYILPDVDFDDTARLDVGQLSYEELQALIDSYNVYDNEGKRVRNLDEIQRSEEERAKEVGMELGLSESETQADIDKKNKEFNRERKRIARAIKERDARARGEVSQLSEADFDALAEEAQRKRRKKPTQIDMTTELPSPAPTPTPAPAPAPTPTPTAAPTTAPEPVTEFEFTKSEGKPDPKYIGGAVVEYANDFSRAVRISPKAKVFKSVRARLKKQYNLTDSQLDDLRKKANRKLLEQKRAGRPLSLDMTTELPSPAPVPTPTPTPTAETGDVVAETGAKSREPLYEFIDPSFGFVVTKPMTLSEVKEQMDLQNQMQEALADPNTPDDDPRVDLYEGPVLNYRYMREVTDEDVVAGVGKQTVSYDLLDSSYINDYDGKEAEDTTLPDYDSLHYVVSEPNRQAINEAIESGAVDQLANDIAEEASEMMENPQIAAGIGWYSRMRVRLQEIFGTDTELFTHLLGTTSAQTAVELNFRYSVDLYNRFKSGEFDSKIKKYLELRGRMQAGTLGDLLIRIGAKNLKGVTYTKDLVKKSQPSALLQSAARHYDLLPKQKSGDLYGANSYPALKALSEVWFEDRIGPNRMTPKTPQFAMNLNGQSMEATIDVWAARLLHRKIHGGQTRILPSEETAVENGDFALGQVVFRRAGEKLGMNPDDLQALVWFGEKQIWDQNGWTGAAGALKSSFDEPAAVFYPETGTRSEEDANLILDFIAAERLVKRDIDFPNAVKPATQANNRKAYDEYLRSSVISDYIKSTGRRTVYEGRSVESDRKRQVTRSINRLRGYGGSVSYRKGQGKEPKRSLKVVERSDYLDSKEEKTASEVFSETAARNKQANRFGSSVDVLDADDYNNHDIIVTSSKKGQYVTLSISPDGEITSVTKSKGATRLDVSAAFDMAISTGKVKYLNGFETILPDLYANYGFTPVARLKFDPQFQPPGWSYSTYREFNKGKPDVIFMRFDGTMGSVYDPTGFPEVQSYEDGIEAARTEVTVPADVSAEAITAQRPSSPEGGFDSVRQLEEFIRDNFKAVASKVGVDIVPNYTISTDAQYNVTKGYIEYNPRSMFTNRTQDGTRAAMREEIIHAAMHKVLMQRSPSKSRNNAWLDFMGKLGKDLTQEQRSRISGVYSNLQEDHQFGAEYSRAAIQYLLYGSVTEQYVVGGKSWETIKSLFKSVQRFLARALGKEINENLEAAAVISDSVDLVLRSDPDARITNQKIVSDALVVASGLDAMSSENISDPSIGTYEERTRKQQLSRIKRSIARVIQPASEFFNSINPRITQELRKYLTGIEEDQFRAAAMVQDFLKGISGIKNKQDRNELDRLLSYSPDPQSITEGEHKDNIRRRDELLLKYDLYNKYKLQVRPLLDQLYQQAIDAGLDVNYLQEYFPRRIKDFVGLMNLYGKDVNEDFLDYVEQENKRRSESGEKLLIPSDYPTEFDNYLNQKKFVQPSRIPANLKERRTNMISKEAQPFYYEPEVALSAYLNNIVEAIATQNLVGNATRTKKQPVVVDGQTVLALNLNDPTGSLNRVVGELVANGEITKGQMQSLEYGLVQFLQPKNASEGDLFKLSRTFGYGTLLVEVTSTLSNMYDMAFTMLDNGILPSLGAMVGRKSVRMRDLGFDPDRLSAEYPMGGKGKTKFFNDLVKTGLTVTGFRRMDQLMKETNLTANYRRFQRLAKLAPNSNKHQKFRKEVEFLVGSDVDNVINDLKLNKPDSPFVRNLLTNKILETQPLNRLELPLLANDNANGRALYLMKSFMVKQMGLIWRRQISVMINRDLPFKQRSAAAREVVKLLLLFILVGLPVDFFKDLLAGRDVYPDDYVTNALLRVAGMSKYTIYQAKREGLGGAARAYFMPVGIDQTLNMATDIGNVLMDPSSIPDTKAVSYLPFSDWWYYRYGPGVEKQERQRTRKRKEGVRPGVSEFIESLGL